MLPRRQLLQLAITGAALAGTAHSALAVAAHQPLDLGQRSAQDDLLIWAKLKADLSGRTVFAVTTGTVWGFKPQADELPLADFSRRLYGYRSCVARQARLNSDGTVSIKSRSWNFYLDAGSSQFVTELLNSYTGKTLKSAPMIGPVSVQNCSTAGLLDFKPAYPIEQLTSARAARQLAHAHTQQLVAKSRGRVADLDGNARHTGAHPLQGRWLPGVQRRGIAAGAATRYRVRLAGRTRGH
jgi:hypothetical protein